MEGRKHYTSIGPQIVKDICGQHHSSSTSVQLEAAHCHRHLAAAPCSDTLQRPPIAPAPQSANGHKPLAAAPCSSTLQHPTSTQAKSAHGHAPGSSNSTQAPKRARPHVWQRHPAAAPAPRLQSAQASLPIRTWIPNPNSCLSGEPEKGGTKASGLPFADSHDLQQKGHMPWAHGPFTALCTP